MKSFDFDFVYIYHSRWGFTPLIEAERFQHDFVFRYLAKYVEDNFPEALEELLKKQDEEKLAVTQSNVK